MERIFATLVAALLLLFPGATMAQPASNCAVMTAEVERLSARLSESSARSQTQLDSTMAEQARYAKAAKQQRSAGAMTDVLASAIGAVVPGAEQLGSLRRMAAPSGDQAAPAPERTSLEAANVAMIEQGDTAVRIGRLIEALTAAGCPGAGKSSTGQGG